MKNRSNLATISDFVCLRDQASVIPEGRCPLSLWIACTDSTMEPVLDRVSKSSSAIFLRKTKFEVPASKADIRNELSAINFAVDRLRVSNIVVCGHSLCSCFPDRPAHERRATPSGGIQLLQHGVIQRQAKNEEMRKHLIRQLQKLETYSSVKSAIRVGRLRIHGLFYLAESGAFSFYDQQSNSFPDLGEML